MINSLQATTPTIPDARISPLIIPRRYLGGPPSRLSFYVVFMFEPADGAGNGTTLVQHLQTESWPKLMARVIQNCRLHVEPRGASAYDAAIELWTPSDLAAAKWKWPYDSEELWQALVVPSLTLPPVYQTSPLVRVIKDRAPQQAAGAARAAGSRGAEHPFEHLRVNPIAASDLRPGQRIESFDAHSVATALASYRHTRADAVADNPTAAQLLMELHELRQLEDFLQFLNWSAYPDDADQLARECRHVFNMFSRSKDFDPRFTDTIREALIASPQFQAIAGRILGAYHYYALHGGQVEFRRLRRFIRSARNRSTEPAEERHSGRTTSNGRGIVQLASHGRAEGQRVTGGCIERPSFIELMSQVRAHCGLARRLGLALYCSIQHGGPGDNAVEEGRARLELANVDDASRQLFVDPTAATRYELSAGANAFFRPQPNDEPSFLGTNSALRPAPGTRDDVWRRYHVVPGNLFGASQDDYSLAAARAYAEPTAGDPALVSRGVATDDASSAASAHRVDSVNIYSKPLATDSTAGITVAEAIERRLARNGATDSPSDKFAEDLMQGYTVFARRGTAGGERPRAWRSLSRRMACLEVLSDAMVRSKRLPGWTQNVDYSIEFEEEGFVSNSMIFALAPETGMVTSVGDDEFTVDVIGAGNQSLGKRTFKPRSVAPGEPETLYNGIFVSQQSCDQPGRLAPGDVVIVTPADPPQAGQDKYWAAEVAIYPVLAPDARLGGWSPATSNWNDLQGVRACAVRRVAPAGAEPSDGSHTLLVASHATRFLDELGHVIAPPDMRYWKPLLNDPDAILASKLPPCLQEDPRGATAAILNPPLKSFERFVVEGERRFYALPRLQAANAGTPQPFWPVAAAAPSAVPALVFNSIGGSNLLDPVHFAGAAPRWRFIGVPRFLASGWGSPDQPGGTDDVMTTDQVETLAVLDDPAFDVVRGKAAKVNFTLTAKLKQASAPGDASKTIGFGTPAQPWTIQDGALPSIPQPGTDAQSIQFLSYAPISYSDTQPTVLANGVAIARLTGHAVVNGAKLQLIVEEYEPGWVLKVDDALPPTLEWSIDIETQAGSGTRSVRYSQPRDNDEHAMAAVKAALASGGGKRFCHPASVAGQYIEAIGDVRGSVTQGRAWPQNAWATFDKVASRLIFADATVANYDPNGKTLAFADGPTFTGIDPWAALPDGAPSGRFQIGPAQAICAADDDGLVVAGEVSNVTLVTASNTLAGCAAGDLVIELAGVEGEGWTLCWPAYCGAAAGDRPHLRPSSKALPPRALSDLQPGESLVVRCDLFIPAGAKDNLAAFKRWVKPRVVPPAVAGQSITAIVKGVVCLMGEIAVPEISPVISASEGTDVYHPCTLLTGGGHKLVVWCEIDATTPRYGNVAMASCSAILAETITRIVPPVAPDSDDASAPAPQPVHGTTSELIARWAGWSLSVPMRGKADQSPGKPEKRLPFRITAYLPDGCSSTDGDRDWKMTPLRFGQPYEICLRRVDLAGNHEFDEGLPEAAISGHGFNTLAPIEPRTPLTMAREHAAGARRGRAPAPAAFERTTPPGVPLLAFPPQAAVPHYTLCNGNNPPNASLANTALVNTAPANTAPVDAVPAIAADFIAVAHQREPSLVLISDVLAHTNMAAGDAACWLLPPPCAVETVITSGRLDVFPAEEVGDSIYWHERYFDDKLYGLCANGYTNYFGDPNVDQALVGLKHPAEALGRVPATANQVRFFGHNRWPQPTPIGLAIDAGRRRPEAVGGAIALGAHAVSVVSEQGGQEVRFRLPPGAERDAVFDLLGTPRGVPHSVRLVHATNGAWTRPRWVSLEEELPLSSDPVSNSSRTLSMKLEVDVPTSGGYQVLAYWSDHWDEGISAQYRPAAAVARVNRHGVVTQVDVSNGGFGFGADAVALFDVTPATGGEYPILQVLSVDGRIDSANVLSGGSGWKKDLTLRIIRRPPFHQEAQARVSALKRDGAIDAVYVDDGGGWYFNPPLAIAHDLEGSGYGAVLRARLDHLGRVASVVVDQGGRGYSKNVSIRFYTNQHLTTEKPIAAPFAVARAFAVAGPDKQLTRVDIVDGGGPYQAPPFVVAHDLGGNGGEARLTARLDAHGAVVRVDVEAGGNSYSPRIALGFYTDRNAIPTAPNDEKTDLSARDIPKVITIDVDQPFGDSRGRRVDYVVNVSSRFRKYLSGTGGQRPASWERLPAGEQAARTHVPRLSVPWQIEVSCRARPVKPSVAYLMHAFRWTATLPLEATLDDAKQFFRQREQGRIIVRRTSLVRVYLDRPWNGTGREQLGVVVSPAVLNTARSSAPSAPGVPPTFVSPDDGGSYNVARSAQAAVQPGFSQEPLDDYATQLAIRPLATQWGSDALWNEEDFEALSADRFLARLTDPILDWVPLSDKIAPGDTAPASFTSLPQWIALHEVVYDTWKERWYSDIEINLTDREIVRNAKPFVQLALVTYQSRSLENRRVSPVKQAMFKLDGQRVLEIERHDRNAFTVVLRGDFEHPPNDTDLPRREVVVELRLREGALPAEILEYVPPPCAHGAAVERSTGPLLVRKLHRKKGRYARRFEIPDDVLREVERHGAAMLWIFERELFPSAGEHLSATDRRVTVVGGRPCEERIVFSFAAQIGPDRDLSEQF